MSNQLAHELAFLIVADRQTIAGSELAPMELMLLEQVDHRSPDLLELLALALHLFLQVEHRFMRLDDDLVDIAQQHLEPLALPVEHIGEGGEALRLIVREVFQVGEGNALKEFGILFDLPAKEVLNGKDEQCGFAVRPKAQEAGEGIIPRATQEDCCLVDTGPFRFKTFVRILQSAQASRFEGQFLRNEVAPLETAALAGGVQVGEALLAKGDCFVAKLRRGNAIEKGTDLQSKSTVLGTGEGYL